jgi:hypothetical protein
LNQTTEHRNRPHFTTQKIKMLTVVLMTLVMGTLSACSGDNESAREPAVSPTAQASVPEGSIEESKDNLASEGNATQEGSSPEVDKEDGASLPGGTGNVGTISPEELLEFFPGREDVEDKNGDFGYKLGVHEVDFTDKENLKIQCVGQYKKSVTGAAEKVFNLDYSIKPDGVYESVSGNDKYFIHPVSEMKVLAGPLQKGTTWKQEVLFGADDKQVLMEALIHDVREVKGKAMVEVRYAARVDGYTGGIYREERIYMQDAGLVFYANVDQADKVFAYRMAQMKDFSKSKK